jgi:excisionase family DNA binding protein
MDDTRSPGAPLQVASAVAALLNISERGLYRLVESGKVPHYRVGGQLRFDSAEVLQALRGRVPA